MSPLHQLLDESEQFNYRTIRRVCITLIAATYTLVGLVLLLFIWLTSLVPRPFGTRL